MWFVHLTTLTRPYDQEEKTVNGNEKKIKYQSVRQPLYLSINIYKIIAACCLPTCIVVLHRFPSNSYVCLSITTFVCLYRHLAFDSCNNYSSIELDVPMTQPLSVDIVKCDAVESECMQPRKES